LDNILQKANTYPYTELTDDELKNTIDYLKERVLNEYFFSKLKNPEWVRFFEKKKLLYFWKDFANCYAERYLLEIADKRCDEVYDIIELFWEDLRQDKMLVGSLYHIFGIGIKDVKNKKRIFAFYSRELLIVFERFGSVVIHLFLLYYK
jgi:hypothetical protein